MVMGPYLLILLATASRRAAVRDIGRTSAVGCAASQHLAGRSQRMQKLPLQNSSCQFCWVSCIAAFSAFTGPLANCLESYSPPSNAPSVALAATMADGAGLRYNLTAAKVKPNIPTRRPLMGRSGTAAHAVRLLVVALYLSLTSCVGLVLHHIWSISHCVSSQTSELSCHGKPESMLSSFQ